MGKILDGAVFLLYPLIVYVGLTYLSVRWTALFLLLLTGRRFVALVLKSRSTSRIVLVQATAMVVIIGSAAVSGSAFALRVAPFLVSLTFIAMFAISLGSTPVIERFARLQRPDLPVDHVAYCRTLTKIWIGVLAVNSLVLLVASLCRDEALWAILVGPVSYGLLGFVFAVEYIFRKWLFQEFSKKSIIDQLLKLILTKKDAS